MPWRLLCFVLVCVECFDFVSVSQPNENWSWNSGEFAGSVSDKTEIDCRRTDKWDLKASSLLLIMIEISACLLGSIALEVMSIYNHSVDYHARSRLKCTKTCG